MKSSQGSSRQQKNLIRRDCLGSHARLQMVHVHVTQVMVHVHVTQVLTDFKRQVGAGDDGDMETSDGATHIKLTSHGATHILCLLTNAMTEIALKSK